MFTKEFCGPCGLVKYIIKDERESIIQEVYLDDFSNQPISEENLALAKKTATPVLVNHTRMTEKKLHQKHI